jgi:hypothetical protein
MTTQPISGTGHGLPSGPDTDASQAPGRPAGPGVPLSIWPGLPAPGSAPPGLPCGGPVTIPAAGQIITAFSRPGDLVTAVDGSPAVLEAAAAAGRPVLGLIPALGGQALAGLRARLDPAVRLRPGGPALLLTPGDPDAGQAALAVAGCHGPGCCAAPDPGGYGTVLYAACERLLRPGGILAVITASPAPDGPPAGLAGGTVVAAARAAGLGYAQHIVLVHAAISGDRLDPGPAALSPAGGRIHSDLQVFTKPQGARP